MPDLTYHDQAAEAATKHNCYRTSTFNDKPLTLTDVKTVTVLEGTKSYTTSNNQTSILQATIKQPDTHNNQ